jgi:two-component system, OmpR family, osmolarity sensor histidine kinase EnvZ
MRWPLRGILLRLVLAQIVVVGMAFVAMVMMVGQQRGAAAARTIAPLWAEGAQRLLGQPPPQDRESSMRIAPRVGLPPANAARARALRYGVLRDELAARGLVVGEIRTSRSAGRETTWLEVQAAPDSVRWIGFDGGVFGPEETVRRWPLLLVVFALVVLASALVTWSVARPLARLQRAVERFGAQGDWSPSLLDRSDDLGRGGPHEVRELERSFAAMTRERARLEHDRTLMLAGVSHDLRSPLARIRLNADLLPDGEPVVVSAKAAIKRNVDLADRHLAAFLDYAAPVAAEERTPVDVRQLWQEAAAMVLPAAAGIAAQVDPGMTTLLTNRRLLVRVLAFGLENADKHGAPPITARSFVRGAQAVFEVEDGGTGLAPRERDRVMRPFERGERARTTPGTGLGLALAAQIAARLGGRIELDQARRGLIFRCVLPRDAAAVNSS